MSQENVKGLLAMYEAFSREDFGAAAELLHPDVEFTVPGQGTIRGADAVQAWAAPDALEAHTIEPLDFEIKGDTVVVHQHHQARGATSGIDVKADAWVVYTFDEDGLVTRAESFLEDQSGAFAAAGLAE